jgi:hypothetical protein
VGCSLCVIMADGAERLHVRRFNESENRRDRVDCSVTISFNMKFDI